MSKSIGIEQVSRELQKILNSYSEKVAKAVNETTEEVANETVEFLKSAGNYVDRTGKYRKSFKINKELSLTGVTSIVYSSQASLTHLLEKGHATRNGTKRTRAFPHWSTAEEFAINTYERKMKNNLERLT